MLQIINKLPIAVANHGLAYIKFDAEESSPVLQSVANSSQVAPERYEALQAEIAAGKKEVTQEAVRE